MVHRCDLNREEAEMFYSKTECCSMFHITPTTLVRWADPKHGNGFPAPVRLGISRPDKRSQCRVGYPKAEVDEWAQARMNERKAPPTREQDDAPDEE